MTASYIHPYILSMNIKAQITSLLDNISGSQSSAPATASESPDSPKWVSHVAMLTGALAALAGFLTVRSTVLTNQAIYESNQAILSQTQSSDGWAEYQADSIKAHMAEVQLIASPALDSDHKKQLEAISVDMRTREPKIKQQAMDKATERDNHLGKAKQQLQQKDILGYAGMATQLGIALASVAALIRRRIIFNAGITAGAVSVILTAYAFISSMTSN